MKKPIPPNSLFIDQAKVALEKARAEFHLAIYLGECGSNAGIRKIWSERAGWLAPLIYLAEAQIAREEVEVEFPRSLDSKACIEKWNQRDTWKGITVDSGNDILDISCADEEVWSETICMDEGPNQFETIKYRPTCVHGCTDCIWDPAYIYTTYPNWYKRLYGETTPAEVACENCANGERYDDEDK